MGGGAEVDALAKQLGLRRPAPIYSNAKLDTPVVCGLLKPKLIVPENFFALLSKDERRWVLLHELAHLRRGDLLALAFQRLLGIALFFNPSIWVASRAANRLREFACDDAVVTQPFAEAAE